MNDAKFRIFDDALVSLSLSETAEARECVRIIQQGQRFYMPSDVHLVNLEQRVYGDGIFLLPYPEIAVLSETREFDSNGEETGRSVPFISCCRQVVDSTYSLVSIVGHDVANSGRRLWIPSAAALVYDKAGVVTARMARTRLWQQLNDQWIEDGSAGEYDFHSAELEVDVDRVSNLLALLALNNVKTERIEAPLRLNLKRIRNGKLPLYSYHVLNVAGSSWGSNETGNGNGFRSHLRRGHIRRIANDRAVWVRAAYVHGRTPGFVDKDYNVQAGA